MGCIRSMVLVRDLFIHQMNKKIKKYKLNMVDITEQMFYNFTI